MLIFLQKPDATLVAGYRRWQELVVRAILAFDPDLSQLCYDITSIAFTGDYDQAELVRYGYSRDQRPDLKQVELAVNVTVEGGVPVDYRGLAGSTADRTTPVENLAHLPQVDPARPPLKPLFISDRAMLTPQSMAAYCQHAVRFLGPYDGGAAGDKLLREMDAEEFASLAVVVSRFPDGSVLWRRSGLGPNHMAVLEALGLPLAQGYSILNC